MTTSTRAHIDVRGAVQGVGFRPFVFRLAHDLELNGWVSNSTEGVSIEVEGPKDALDRFLVRLSREHPARASIHGLEVSFHDPAGYTMFQIRPSESTGRKRALVLPDIATCDECLREIFDPANRRHLYPFTNCTNCGPRFTIIEALPYDRPNTTMRAFTMCARCRAEYENPLDRRFHAQPNACAECGPHVEMWDASGNVIADRQDAIRRAAEAIRDGLIVAVKGLGGFHLMADAASEQAVRLLRARKRREEKPFAVMATSLAHAAGICEIDSLEERLLEAPEAPIVLLRRRAESEVVRSVAPNNPYLGVMLPSTPLHHVLMKEVGRVVVATSGNRTDEPIVTDEREAIERLDGLADHFLTHDRRIHRHADDSIVRVILGREQVLRRARGYAPMPLPAKGMSANTFAVGGHLKNTVALASDDRIVLSQHLGDLETEESLKAFRSALDDLEYLYDAHPAQVVVDLHPDYVSTHHGADFAASRSIPLKRIQHHWAHALSCMADNGIDAPALAVVWDGSGYGTDGTLWGGEFLLITDDGFRRVARLRTFPVPGGDAAARRPRLSAAGLLHEIQQLKELPGSVPTLVAKMLEKEIHTPRTSSMGRLFDAVAYLAGLADDVSYEGQAAMSLEFSTKPNVEECYSYLLRPGDPIVIDWEPIVRRITIDARNHVGADVIAARFHNALAEMIVEVARHAGQRRVVLTGGCFQNRYLTERAVRRLNDHRFHAYWHQRVPPNDGGLALGQIIAASRLNAREKPCALQSQDSSLKRDNRMAS